MVTIGSIFHQPNMLENSLDLRSSGLVRMGTDSMAMRFLPAWMMVSRV